MFTFLNKPIGWIIKLCYQLVPNYALALLFFALIMKVLLFPFGIKQQKNMVRQAKLRPKEMAIRNRYAGRTDKPTQQKMQQDLMKLYQDEHYNPASGCLPMILQLVIIFALFNVIQKPLTYVSDFSSDEIKQMGVAVVQLYDEDKLDKEDLSALTIEQIEKQLKNVKDNDNGTKDYTEVGNPLSAQGQQMELVRIIRDNYDALVENGLFPEGKDKSDLPNFTIFGGSIDLARTPNFNSFNWLLLIPLLTFVFTFGSMKITKKLTYQPVQPQTADAGCSMKMMDYMMPLMSTFFTFQVPAVIAVYWIYQNVFSTVQQLVLKLMYPIPTFTEEEYKEAEREMNKGIKQPKSQKRAAKRAAHRIDLDDEATTETAKEIAEPKAPAKTSGIIPPAALKDESDKPEDN